MRRMVLGVAAVGLCWSAQAGQMTSAYTDFSPGKDCSVYDINEDEGAFVSMVCPGWGGYPVIFSGADARESLYYGFPPDGAVPWESFGPFNGTSSKIEWRIETDGEKAVPIATIHRWTVSDPEDDTKKTEVLVVEKVGRLDERNGCAVGLVVATGNPKANETARRIADESVRDFVCGADEPLLVSGDVALPSFSRAEN